MTDNKTLEDMADPPGVIDDKTGASNTVEPIGPPDEHPAIVTSRNGPPPARDNTENR